MAVAFADVPARTFVIASKSGGSYHLVHPADADDRRVQDGLVQEGALVCDGCRGGRYRGTCHACATASQLIAAAATPLDENDPATWFDMPAGAGDAVEAFRG